MSDPEAKTDRVGGSSTPARTLVVAGTSLGVCPVGYEGNGTSPNSKVQVDVSKWRAGGVWGLSSMETLGEIPITMLPQ